MSGKEEFCYLLVSDDRQTANHLRTVFSFMDKAIECCSWSELAAKGKCRFLALLIDIESKPDSLQADDLLNKLGKPALVLCEDPSCLERQADFGSRYIVGHLCPTGHIDEFTSALRICHLVAPIKPNGTSSQLVALQQQLIGVSENLNQVRHLIMQVADTDASVLVLGESGTGKEVIAKCIHQVSGRASHPFVPVNCGAIPGELLESELFGHEKGAFTGALSSRQGRFEMAQGGTIFLDEIGDMPLEMQVKLLRVLQERTFERVGGNKQIKCDVRVIAATHRNLEELVEQGKFREDLFYRLNVFPIKVSPLRERPEDVPPLVEELVKRYSAQQGVSIRLTNNALTSLTRHGWPGNVRELSNLIERLSILFPYGLVDLPDLPERYQHSEGLDLSDGEQAFGNPLSAFQSGSFRPDSLMQDEQAISSDGEKNGSSIFNESLPKDGLNLKEFLAAMEVKYINQALSDEDWVVARAAERLQLRRTTLVEKMRKYGLNR